MTDITNFSLSDATVRSHALTTLQEITQYTVDWTTDLVAAGFANGDECILVVKWTQMGSSTSNDTTVEVQIGSSFPAATHTATVVESLSTTTHQGARQQMWVEKITLNTNDNIYIGSKIETSGTVAVDDFCLLIMKLGDLATDDWRYDDHTSSGDAPATPTTAATVTLPAASGDDWLILSSVDWLVDGVTNLSNARLNLDASGYMVQLFEGRATTEELSNGLIGVLPAAASSAVCKLDIWDSGTNDYTRSAIFALRLEAFTDHNQSYSSTAHAVPGVDVAQQTNTLSFSLTTTGNVAVFAQTIQDSTATDQVPYHRVQADGTDIVTDLGRIGYRVRDAAEQNPLSSFSVESMTSGTKTIDVDCFEDASDATTYNWDEHTLVAFSMDLAGGATSPIIEVPPGGTPY